MFCESNVISFVKEIATDLGFNVWDWCAVLISICSVFIALASLLIASKTLKSQKKTEQNTLPIINKDVQLTLLSQIIRDVYDTYVLLCSLDFLLQETDYNKKPSSHFWNLVKLNSDTIHEHLFYNDSNKYTSIHELKVQIDTFNYSLDSLKETLQLSIKNNKMYELSHLYDEIGAFITLFKRVLKNNFDIDDGTFIESIFLNYKNDKFRKIFANRYFAGDYENIIKYYVENSKSKRVMNDVYHKLFDLVVGRNSFSILNENDFCDVISKEVDSILISTPVEVDDKFEFVNLDESTSKCTFLINEQSLNEELNFQGDFSETYRHNSKIKNSFILYYMTSI